MNNQPFTKPILITNPVANNDALRSKVYATIEEALGVITPELRAVGRTFEVQATSTTIKQYWWQNPNDLSDGGISLKTSHIEPVAQPTKYEIISEAPLIAGIASGTDTDGYVIIGATPTNLLSFTYDGSAPFEYNSYIELDTTIDLEHHKRYDVVCLTPTGDIELIEGIPVGVISPEIPAIPPIPPNYFPYAYVLWDGTATALLADKVTKLSQLFNDVGFITLGQLTEKLGEKEDRVSVMPITANTTISSIHHGKILLITADVVVTFPTGLGATFTGCAFRIATGGKMTPAFGSGVTGNNFFADYNPGESLYVFKERNSTNVFYAV